MQKWVVVDELYLNYLRTFDARVPFSNYGADKMKPFFGVLFSVGDLVYLTQVSHPQQRHQTVRNSPTFHKIYIPDRVQGAPDRLIAVVNLNYMFPMPKSMLKFLQYADIEQYRTFTSDSEKNAYIDLLKKELSAINNATIASKAYRLYQVKNAYPEATMSQHCIDFKTLEAKALAYNPI